LSEVARFGRAAGRLNPKSGALAVRLALLVVTLAFAPEASSAAARALPQGRLFLEATDGRIEIEIAPEASATVSVVDGRTGADLSDWLETKASEDGTALRLVPGEAKSEERPVVKLRVRKGQRLEMTGSRLDVLVAGKAREPAEATAAPKVEPTIVGRLGKSTFRATGLVGPEVGLFLTTDGGEVRLDECETLVDARVTGGSLKIPDHRGLLRITGKDADVHLEGGTSEPTVNLTGGTATFRDGGGSVALSMNGAKVWVDQWTGALRIEAAHGNLDVVRSATKLLDLKLTDTFARIEQGSGRAGVKCTGGAIDVDGFGGPVTITATDRASVSATGVTGALRLTGTEAARLDVKDSRGAVTLTATGGEVSVERASSLKLAATDATVSVRGVAKLLPVTLRGSTGELDLVETLGNLAVSVALGSRIDVRVAEPCEVQAGGPGAKLGGSISCSGCDLKLPNHPRLGRPKQYIRGTRRAILALTLDEDSRVTIDAK
jgi:hypothetical protein